MSMSKGWPSPNKKKKGEPDMATMKSRWLERIEVSIPALEILDEKFFGVSQFMTESSFVFGGAVAAIILGEPIMGDLDIAVSQHESSNIISSFSSSPKWLTRGKSDVRGDSYRGSNMETRVSQIINFTSFGAAKVQVITARAMTEDKVEDALDVIRGVDFSFCGLGIDFQGQLFEAVRGAYEDCLKKKIRIVREKSELSGTNLERRIKKYIDRGFTCFEDYSGLLKELEGKEPEKKLYSPGGVSSFIRKRDFIHKRAHMQVINGARKFVVNGELMNKYNITNDDGRFDDFMNYVSDHLAQAVSDNSPECTANDISAEAYWDSMPEGEDPDGIMFSFDPYDPNTNWARVEQIMVEKIASHPFLQGDQL